MPRRVRSEFKQPSWADQLQMLKAEVVLMPPGPEREAARRRARQLETAIQINDWLKPADVPELG